MTFRDWQDVEASKPLELPIRGKTYRIPALGHLDEIRIRENIAAVRAGNPPEVSNEEFLLMMLGDQLAQMRDDNVPNQAIVHAAAVAHVDAEAGRPAAEELWERGPSPEALAAAMKAAAQIQAKGSADSTTSPSTAAATSSTKRPASTSGTSSRPAKKAARSTGTRSSRSRASSPRTSSPSTASD